MFYAKVKNARMFGLIVEGKDHGDPQEGAILAGIPIEVWEYQNQKDGQVVANVLLTRNGEILTDFKNNDGIRTNRQVLESIEEAKTELKEIWDKKCLENSAPVTQTKYVAVIEAFAVRDVQIFPGEDPDPISDEWTDAPGSEVFVGIYSGTYEEVLAEAAEEAGVYENNIRLIPMEGN